MSRELSHPGLVSVHPPSFVVNRISKSPVLLSGIRRYAGEACYSPFRMTNSYTYDFECDAIPEEGLFFPFNNYAESLPPPPMLASLTVTLETDDEALYFGVDESYKLEVLSRVSNLNSAATSPLIKP